MTGFRGGGAVSQVVRAGRQLSFQTDWRTLYQLGRQREMKSKVKDYTNHTPVFYKRLDRMRWLFHYLHSLVRVIWSKGSSRPTKPLGVESVACG